MNRLRSQSKNAKLLAVGTGVGGVGAGSAATAYIGRSKKED